MTRKLSISEFRRELSECFSFVEKKRNSIVVTRQGKPVAVLVNYVEYERLKETLDVLSDPDLMQQIRKSQTFYKKGKTAPSFENVFWRTTRSSEEISSGVKPFR